MSGELVRRLYVSCQKDAKKLSTSGLRPKAEELLSILAKNPYRIPPPYEKLVGELHGAYSRRINIQHRLVYQVIEEIRSVKILSIRLSSMR